MKKNKSKVLQGGHRILIALFAMFLSLGAFAQKIPVTGQVVDSNNEPIIGASVSEKGTTNGTITDIDGQFTLNVDEGVTLLITYVGFKPQEIKASKNIKVTLEENTELLDEVVVIGYGTVKRKDVTTAISTVSTKDMDQRPIISAGQAIQGKAAGVSVIQPNGTPGGELSIRVRGTTSFNGSNDPLYVVDGVPVDNINFLAPNDIASMQILKDASSAAIYGSRAANGVIIISTKAGQSGNAKVSFNTQLGLNKVSNSIKSLNAAQYKELQDEIGGAKVPEGTTDVTDWFDEVYSTGVTQSYQVSVSDGTDKLKYFLSAGYLDEKGVLDAAFFKRYSFRANIDNQVRKWLNISANVSYTDNTNNGITTGQGSNRGGVVLSVINLPTSIGIYKDEEAGLYNRSFYGMNISNPIESLQNSKNNKTKENRLIASGNILLTFIPELTLKSSFTLDRRNSLQTGFTPPVHADDRDDWGNAWDNRNMNTVLTFDNILTYNKTFNKHGLELMGGSSWTDSDYTNSWINGSHYRSDQIKTLNAANKISWDGTGSGASQWGIMSYIGRAAYNYDSKYLFTANVRADGSSKLHPDHRWGTFPSFSAAWRISSEEFMQGLDWLDDLKIRGGWGQTGNQSGIGDYAYLQRYNIRRIEWFKEDGNGDVQENALPTISQANLPTRDLKWETTTQTNIGVDLTALNNRLTINMDYYYKRTKDMLMWVTLPTGAAAANSIQRNEGEMTNKGFEFSVNSRNFEGEFSWTTDFNISFNRNKLEKLALQKIYNDAWPSDVLKTAIVRNQPGRSLGGFYGYISDGVDPETGDLIYRDVNGNGKKDAGDRTFIGDPNPDFTYGLTNTFSWKNFNLSIFIQGSYGNDVYNASRIDTEGMYDGKNQSTRVLNRWRIPGQITDVPRANFNIENSSYFVEDGSYLRIKDISLSYNFKGSLLKKLGVSRLQPYFTATNLVTWTSYTGMDPEVNQWGNSGAVQGVDWGTYPHSKSYVFGLNVEF
ncbi:TonB-dependent receptor [Dysgonomonas sp. Marseille-P4677]|uniref:SusC/RagA family TonB-linked outer membrane protein n=1 Tax=Dysgonomonas sp. Marseille-P4677 TaxID=2364790 RepID=UPI0019140202|nr:TonB-dependent receptor [Dysgonomonas sp. Marseille-P4677]MBK5722065.1 TonB-dependent receptor [Dysgonomonas sp. Marseille-P4677]